MPQGKNQPMLIVNQPQSQQIQMQYMNQAQPLMMPNAQYQIQEESVAERYYNEFKRYECKYNEDGVKRFMIRDLIHDWIKYLQAKSKKEAKQLGEMYIQTDRNLVKDIDLERIRRELKYAQAGNKELVIDYKYYIGYII